MILPLLILSLSLYPFISSSCPCIHFNTTGIFHSPNYPLILPPTNCLLYHFIAPINHRVRIVFNNIALPKSPKCDSFLHIYDQLQWTTLNKTTKPQIRICNNDISSYSLLHSPLYSLYRHLILHISTKYPSKGFTGTYSFFSKDDYRSNAKRITDCAYLIDSKNGSIFSSRFPYSLPPSINCSYHFPSREKEELRLIGSIFELSEGCTMYTKEGKDSELEIWHRQSFHMITVDDITLLIQCQEDIERPSFFQIDFDYSSRVGGRYSIEKEVYSSSSSQSNECSIEIISTGKKKGRINSTELGPKTGSLPVKCMISLRGIVKEGLPIEKVSIKFTYFNLYVTPGKSSCMDDDRVLVGVNTFSVTDRIKNISDEHQTLMTPDGWCGDDIPPQMISPHGYISIHYITRNRPHSLNSSYGFVVDYIFHDDWQMEAMNAQTVADKKCRFVFNSTHRKSGELWSVNYPGLYPRDTFCEYIFFGSTSEEVVLIHFEYFDIEGFDQCGDFSVSDYVLFSNYQTHDRTNRKFCGHIHPRFPEISESNYYRLIFDTNGMFDGTGFFARYQFVIPPKQSLSKVKHLLSSSFNYSILHSISIVLFFILYRL